MYKNRNIYENVDKKIKSNKQFKYVNLDNPIKPESDAWFLLLLAIQGGIVTPLQSGYILFSTINGCELISLDRYDSV